MFSPSASAFAKLPTRPPTPPRDVSKAVDDAIAFLDDSNEVERGLKRKSGAIARESSPTAAACSPKVREPGSPTKKVDFTPAPTYHHIDRSGQASSPKARLRKLLPSSRDMRPTKSILKQSAVLAPLTPDELEKLSCFPFDSTPGSFAKMIQSVIHQLSKDSIAGRQDAYMIVNNALRAYEDIPDPDAVVAHIRLFMQFLSRDMAWKNASGDLDVQLAIQALKLAMVFMTHPKISVALDDDFRTFLVERSIAVLEQSELARHKGLVKHHVYLLAQQRFTAQAMTSSRADRIISALSSIEDRCSGNSIVATRLMVYQRLFVQAPGLMLQRSALWLEHVFHAMLSNLKEVRARGIEACMRAGLTLGDRPQAAKAVMDLFQTEVEEGSAFCDHVFTHLTKMLSDKEISALVPQMLSGIVLFFRSKRLPAERMIRLRDWLLVMQKCLNSSDLATKHEAHLAWGKFVYAVMPDSSTSSSTLGFLKIPCASGLDRKATDKHSKQVRQFALDAYINLLHYALRPGLSHDELDTAWKALVQPVLKPLASASSHGRHVVCSVVYGLCTSGQGTWNVNAAFEANPPRPEDLPKLDPKWTRSRLSLFLDLLEPVLTATVRSGEESAANAIATWTALLHSVAEAGAQEIKSSNDLKEALALVVGFFGSLWRSSQALSDVRTENFLLRISELVTVAVRQIGIAPFTEEILVRGKDDKIHVATTPSHRQSKHHVSPVAPLVLLFGLLYHPPAWLTEYSELEAVAAGLLELLVSGRPTPTAQLELVVRSLQPELTKATSSGSLDAALWQAGARTVITILEDSKEAQTRDTPAVGLTLRHAMTVLKHGLYFTSAEPNVLQTSSHLIDAMLDLARSRATAAGTTVGVTEPLAHALLDDELPMKPATRSAMACHLLQTAYWTRATQELDVAKKALWGVGFASHKASAFDAFTNLYRLAVAVMQRQYQDLRNAGDVSSSKPQIIDVVIGFLERCPPHSLNAALSKTQEGFACWLGDRDRTTARLHAEVLETWTNMSRLIESIPDLANIDLQTIQPLLVAAISSPHKRVVNSAIELWNKTFGTQESLDCPEELAGVLRTRAQHAVILMHGSAADVHQAVGDMLPPFFESPRKELSSGTGAQPVMVDAALASSRVPATHLSASPQRSTDAEATSVRRRGSPAPTPLARLRHDDSQILFAPIDSLPLPPTEDSQMFTEHQKEVRVRQHQEAQLFPDLSSSPIGRTAAPQRSVTKRLDFAPRAADNASGTPTRLPEPDLPMSDDIPSSPTPPSTRGVEGTHVDVQDDDLTEEDAEDPPSSPPRHTSDLDHAFSQEADQADISVAEPETYAVSRHLVGRDSDLPSDSILPAEQLQQEADQAAANTRSAQPESRDAAGCDETTLVEETLIEPESPEVQAAVAEPGTNSSSSKKRKRSSDSVRSHKKRKQQSPLKAIAGFFSSFVGSQSQPDDDDDMDDEIVVASGQIDSSPAPQKPPSPVVVVPRMAVEAAPMSAESQVTGTGSPHKRRRNRKRRAEAAVPATSEGSSQGSQTRSLKRKASVLSNIDAGAEPATSFVEDTPAPTKARKQREGLDRKLVKAAKLSQEDTEPRRSSRRTNASSQTEVEEVAEEVEEPAAAPPERAIATPRSIIGRFRDILADLRLPGFGLSRQEEREMDDVLFEIRREVHDAGRRGQ